MSSEFKLSSDFPFAARGERQFSYFGPHNMHIKVEAPSHDVAREIGTGIASAMQEGACPAAQAAIVHFVGQANEKKIPLACSLTYDLV